MNIILTTLLATSLSTFSFAGNKPMNHTLKDEVKLNAEAKVIKVLSNPSFKLIGLGFKKGQALEKHKTPTPAVLIVQSGAVDFKQNGETYRLNAGDYFEIPSNVEHEVVATEDSHLYLVK